MIFKDLINIVNYDDVWVELRKEYKLNKSAYEFKIQEKLNASRLKCVFISVK